MAPEQPTSRLLAQALGNGARVLEIDVPAVGLAGGVLEGEGKDGVALLQGVLAVGLAGVEGGVDRLEGRGGGELVCLPSATGHQMVAHAFASQAHEDRYIRDTRGGNEIRWKIVGGAKTHR